MKNIFEIALLIVLTIATIITASAQTAKEWFNQAKQQYENGNYSNAISTLKQVEQSVGINPKTQSLLVYAYMGNKDYVNAKIALNKYKKMAVDNLYEAHRELLQQEKSIDAELTKLEKNQKQNIEQERMKKADETITSIYNTTKRQQVIAQQKKDQEKLDKIQKEQTYQNIYAELEEREQKSYDDFMKRVDAQFAQKNTFQKEQDEFAEKFAAKAVTIGTQTWTSENIALSYFKNGDPIFFATNITEWKWAYIHHVPAYRYWNFKQTAGNLEGLEYNVFAIMDERGIAPEGWKVPLSTDWQKFINHLNSNKLHDQFYITSRFPTWGKRIRGKNRTGFSAIEGNISKSPGAAYWWAADKPDDWLTKKSLKSPAGELYTRETIMYSTYIKYNIVYTLLYSGTKHLSLNNSSGFYSDYRPAGGFDSYYKTDDSNYYGYPVRLIRQ